MKLDEKKIAHQLKIRGESGGGPRWGCLNEEQIAAYADHRLSGAQKDKVEGHLADCDYCASQVAFLAKAGTAQVTEKVPAELLVRARDMAAPKGGGRSLGWRWRTALSVAAVAACVTVAVVITVRQPTPQNPSVQTAINSPSVSVTAPPSQQNPPSQVAPPQVRSIPSVVALPNLRFPHRDSTIARDKLKFRWDAVQGALGYNVHVTNDEGNVVWNYESEKNNAQVPSSVNLESGKKYFVWIEAQLSKGKSVRSSAIGFTVGE